MTTISTPAENSPSPQEPRGIYGFVLFIIFNLCILFYFLWILIPQSWTASWPYEPPQKYWAAAIPILFCTTLFLFAFCIYPAMHSLHDGDLDELSSITDHYAIAMKSKLHGKVKTGVKKAEFEDIYDKPISPACDMDINDVCKVLYASKETK